MSFLDTMIFGYRTILAAGVELTRRNKVNFVGCNVADNPATGCTDVTPPGAGGAPVAISAFDIDWTLGNVFTKTLTGGDDVFTFSNVVAGKTIFVRVTPDGSFNGSLSWPRHTRWEGGVTPDPTPVLGDSLFMLLSDGVHVFAVDLSGNAEGADAPIDVVPNNGDNTGGEHVVIQVKDSTGLISAQLGGVSLTGFAIDDATHVSGNTPAAANGVKSATVTDAVEPSTARSNAFTYFDPKAIVVGIDTPSGARGGGTHVVIEVSNSLNAAYATLGGVLLTGFAIVDPTHVSGNTGAHAAGAVDIIVNNGRDSLPLVGGYTYVDPVVVAIVPDNGTAAGGTHVVVEVNDSTGLTAIIVGDSNVDNVCTGFAIDDATHVSGDTLAHAAGVVDVNVYDGAIATLPAAYTYT